jgi:hypothetical protein
MQDNSNRTHLENEIVEYLAARAAKQVADGNILRALGVEASIQHVLGRATLRLRKGDDVTEIVLPRTVPELDNLLALANESINHIDMSGPIAGVYSAALYVVMSITKHYSTQMLETASELDSPLPGIFL